MKLSILTPRLLSFVTGATLLPLNSISPLAEAQTGPALGFTSVNGSYLDGGTRMIGWQFRVATYLSVTAMGWFDLGGNGLNHEHQIGIWDSGSMSLVTTVTVPPGTMAALTGFFRYSALSTPVLLLPGHTYLVAGLDVAAGGDAHVWAPLEPGFPGPEVSGFNLNVAITLGAAGSALGDYAAGFSYPSVITAGNQRTVLMGPNLMLAADASSRHHLADMDVNFRISLLELTRVIELYNTRSGTTRTGCYNVDAGGEDGFASDPTRAASAIVALTLYHSADSNHDGKISLIELTRAIELYNYRASTTRTGQYHVQDDTEGGFAPGS